MAVVVDKTVQVGFTLVISHDTWFHLSMTCEVVRLQWKLVWPDGIMVRALDLWLKRLQVLILVVQLSGDNLEQVVHTPVPLSPSSIIWYRSRGSDALRLRSGHVSQTSVVHPPTGSRPKKGRWAFLMGSDTPLPLVEAKDLDWISWQMFCLCCQMMWTPIRPWRWPACVCGAGHGVGVVAGAVKAGAASTTVRCVVPRCWTRSPRMAPTCASTESTTSRRTTVAASVTRPGLRPATPALSMPSPACLTSAGFSSDFSQYLYRV